MKIHVSKEWFRSRAHLEEGLEIGAGSLPRIGKAVSIQFPSAAQAAAVSFGQTISLMRRQRRWTIKQLASEAESTSREIADIEENPSHTPEPSTVFSLAKVFGLPAKALMHKAGLVENTSACLREDSVRYAACSEFKEPLTSEEEQVLDAVIKAMLDHTHT